MEPNDRPVDEFLEGVTNARRRRDADTMIELMRRISGKEPRMWGHSIIGFGEYHYRYETGTEGRAGALGFAPRSAATTVYLPEGVGPHAERLGRLGPHTTSKACVYIKDLEKVDMRVLEEVLRESHRTVTSDTFTSRAER